MSNASDIEQAIIAGFVLVVIVVYILCAFAGKIDDDYERIHRNGHVDPDEDNDLSDSGFGRS